MTASPLYPLRLDQSPRTNNLPTNSPAAEPSPETKREEASLRSPRRGSSLRRSDREVNLDKVNMAVAGALLAGLFAAFSLPCLIFVLVLAEAGLRLAALALRGGDGYAWPTRSAFLGYRIARGAGHFSYSSSAAAAGGGVFQQDELLPPECLDRLAVAVYRRGSKGPVDCVFCLSRVDEGDEVRELRCRHVFHRACLDAWLLRLRATCPLCRDRLLPSEPPRPCALGDDDDDGIYAHDHDDLSSSSATVAASYPHGAALWQM